MKNEDGTQEDNQLRPFLYSETTLLSISDYDQKIEDKVQRVHHLKYGAYGGWVVYPEDSKDKIYADDSVNSLKHVGKVTMDEMHQCGVRTSKEIKEMNKETEAALLENKITSKKWMISRNNAARLH